jgi:solute carrier family 25 folate transporter 32
MKELLAGRAGVSVDQIAPGDVAVSSGTSKVVASTLTYPHEIVRSRLQEQGQSKQIRYTGVIDCVRKIAAEEGVKAFYRGYGTNLMRTTPAAMITLTSHDLILKYFMKAFS